MTIETRLRSLTAAALLALVGIGANAIDVGAAPSVVIVHGAFADASDWTRVIDLLRTQGVQVTAVKPPLTSQADAVAAVRRAVVSQPGKVVLVGHSWEGELIAEAGQDDKVDSLVVVSGFAPGASESGADAKPGHRSASGAGRFIADREGFLRLPEAALREDFAHTPPATRSLALGAAHGPVLVGAFGDEVPVMDRSTKPAWFIVAAQERMIDPGLLRAIAGKIVSTAASRAPQRSRPADVARVILEAVAATG